MDIANTDIDSKLSFMDINEATAKALQSAKAISGLTFDELSEKSGVNVQTIYRMFGAKREIKVPQLNALALALGTTIIEIMEDAERISKRTDNNSRQVNPSRLSEDEKRRLMMEKIAANDQTLAANNDPNKYAEMEHEDESA